jgi:hypothetical protein
LVLKEEVSAEDYFNFLGTFAEPLTGLPVKTYSRIIARILGMED